MAPPRPDREMRAALDKIIDIKQKIVALTDQIQARDMEAAQITADQSRLRENIKALGETAEARQLIARYVAKAGEQETRIEQLTAQRSTQRQARAALQNELDAAIRALNLDRKLGEERMVRSEW